MQETGGGNRCLNLAFSLLELGGNIGRHSIEIEINREISHSREKPSRENRFTSIPH